MNSRFADLLTAWKGKLPSGILTGQPSAARIPRVIHQIYFTPDGAAPPPLIRENIARIRTLNPDWEHRLYDYDAMVDFVTTQYGADMLGYFLRIRPEYGAARADLFRYLLMYRLGGLYLDIKSSTDKPLRTIVRDDDLYVLSQWENGPGEPYEKWGLYPELRHSPRGEFQQWFILAAPGHPFLHAVILRVLTNLHRYDPALHGTGWASVIKLTGPIAYTLAILPLLSTSPHRIIRSHTELGLRYSIFDTPDRHHALFRTHYSALELPLTSQSRADRAASAILYGAKRVYRWAPFGSAPAGGTSNSRAPYTG